MAQRQQPTPLSLNQRLLLSASHSKPLPENSAKQEARRRFNQNDFVPTFSVISDSDSSPSPVRLSSKGTGEAENDDEANIKDTSAFQNDAVPNFSAIADFSPDSAKSSHFGEKEIDDQLKINISAVGNDDVPNFSAIADFSPHSTKSSPFGEKEIGEPKNGTQEKLSNSTEDSFDYQCSGIVEKEIDQPKSETQGTEIEDQSDSSHDSDTSSPLGEKESDKLQEEFSDPPEDFLNTQCSGTVGKVIDQPKSATEVDPQLSGIDDSSSPLSGDMKPSKGVDEDCELSQEGQNDYKKKSNCTSNLPEEEKITKVKIKGRRRLCKISEDNNGSEETKLNDNKESRHFEITDFDSPPQVKNAVRNEQGGSGNEIRDILHDLSSRLEILSIEKKRAPKPSDPLKKDEFPEYHDADSSFSLSSGSSSDSSKVSKTEGEIHKKGLKIDLESESENNCVVRDFNGTRSFGGASKRKEVKQVVGKSKPMIDSFSSYNMMEEEDNNDRHGESENNSVVREFNGTRSFNGAPKRKEVKQVVGKSQAMMNSFSSYNMLEKEDGNDRDGESENDCLAQEFSGTRLFSGAPKRKEVKQVVGKSQPMWNSFSSYNAMEEEGVNGSDDDCVVVGNRSAVNQVERHIRKSRPEPECLDDFESGDFVEERILTLSGPKFTFRLPGNVAKILYPHQRDGLKWLWSLHCQGKGGLLGDDMGLGKTMQICGFLAGLFYSKLVKRVMIVAPKTLLPHWIKELTAVGLSDKIREYFAPNAKLREYELQYVLQDKGILLTTYDIVRNNVKSLCGDHRYLDRDEELTWDYMILDEGHLIKNPSTQRAKSLHEIPCAHRIIISGTPLQNNLKELWALFNFCCPGLLGDKQWFKEKYEHFILRGNDKNAYDRDKRIGSAVAKELREHIQPYFLRRLKSEVFSEDSSTSAKLSKKNEIIVWLKLTNCQRQLYTAFLRSEIVLSAFDSSPLAALTILKKICDHPLLLTKRAAEEVLEEMDSTSNQEDHTVAERLVMQMANVTEKLDVEETHDVSCKITFILALLDKLIPGGHNVLIFSQTRKMLNLIQDSLVSNNFQFMRIDGTTKATDRLKIVNDFQEGRGAPIFLLTSQVGGLGLTLTRADRVIVVDPAWNPSTDNQSVDRAYRIGQTKDVVVYRLMTCATVEEKIYRKQVYKGGLFKTATEHKEQIRYFSQQDLRELFSLPKDGGFDISLTQKQLNEEHDHENKMEEALKAHVKFLETLGIAGVSQHSLLFSKTAPAPVVQDEDRVEIARVRTFVGNSSSYSSVERAVDAEQYAFKPKDVKVQEKSAATRSGPTESDIKDRIGRLYQIFANKDMISRLPDKGERIQTQIAELHKELEIVRMEKENTNEVIDLDDISGRFHMVVNV